jgi:hypothetical protein
VGQLRFLVIGNHVDVWQRHDRDQIGADIDVVAFLNHAFADDTIEGRHDARIPQTQLGRSEVCLAGAELRTQQVLIAVENLELAALCLDRRFGRRKRSAGRVVRGRCLLQPLPCAGDAAAKKRVLSFQLLPRFQLAGEGGRALRLGLGDDGALMRLLVFQVMEDGLGRGDTRRGLRHDRVVVRRLDFHQQVPRFDALEILHDNAPDIAAHPGA